MGMASPPLLSPRATYKIEGKKKSEKGKREIVICFFNFHFAYINQTDG